MKRLLLALMSVAVLLAVTAAPAGAVGHRHVRAHPASAYTCIANTSWAMYYVHAGGGPGGGDTWESWGQMNCGNENHNLKITACMGQLLSSGWNVIWSSCQTYSGYFYKISVPSHWVGLTKGRWYCPYLDETSDGQRTYGFDPGYGVQG